MRRQDFLADTFKDLKFKILFPGELVTTQEDINNFAIGFAEWIVDSTLRVDLDGYKTFGDDEETKPHTIKELLEIYKKEKGL